MTVSELIDRLKALPPDALACRQGPVFLVPVTAVGTIPVVAVANPAPDATPRFRGREPWDADERRAVAFIA